MGRPSRSRKRRDSSTNYRANEVAPSYRRVPYDPVSLNKKNFRRFAPFDTRLERRQPEIRKRIVNETVRISKRSPNYLFKVITNRVQKTVPQRYKPSFVNVAPTRISEDRVRISDHKKLPECQKRSVRKEIMHALNKAGKGGQKSPIWTRLSRKKCK